MFHLCLTYRGEKRLRDPCSYCFTLWLYGRKNVLCIHLCTTLHSAKAKASRFGSIQKLDWSARLHTFFHNCSWILICSVCCPDGTAGEDYGVHPPSVTLFWCASFQKVSKAMLTERKCESVRVEMFSVDLVLLSFVIFQYKNRVWVAPAEQGPSLDLGDTTWHFGYWTPVKEVGKN